MSKTHQQKLIPCPHQRQAKSIALQDMIKQLEQAEAKGSDVFYQTLGDMAKAHGMSNIATSSGLDRTHLYRCLRYGAHPRYVTIKKVLQSLGIKIKLA